MGRRVELVKARILSWWEGLTNEKKAVSATFFVLVFAVTVMAISLESNKLQLNSRGDAIDTFASGLPVELSASDSFGSNPSKLRAMLKGSIYENGSNMTVYGACFDGDGFLLPEANTTFTAWYPNASIMLGPNATMDRVYEDFEDPLANETTRPNGTGRWKIHVTMGDVIGTYLTEIRCEYQGEFAIAFGEWQNPEWVKRIELTQNQVNTNYALLQEIQNQTQQNFSTVISLVNNVSTDLQNLETTTEFSELESVLRDIDRGYWSIDETNPFYVIASGAHMFSAVEMMSPSRVAAVSEDGYFVTWDGETWQEVAVPGAEFNGVGILPIAQPYIWAVGDDGADPAYSVNGDNLTVPSLPNGSATTFNDIKLFQDANNPAGAYQIVVLGDDGSIFQSGDSGASWSFVDVIDSGLIGRMSGVVENYVNGSPISGYYLALAQGDEFATYDGSNVIGYVVSGFTFTATDLLYGDYGYVVGTNSTGMTFFKFNGTGLVADHTVNDGAIEPTGVEINSQNDVWVTTSNPDVIYHFNGRTWEYGVLGSSQFASIVVSFDNLTGAGLFDMSMSDSRNGYAVGSDGVIFKLRPQSSVKFDEVIDLLDYINISLSNISVSVTGNVTVNNTEVLNAINALNASVLSYLSDVNISISGDIANVQSFLTSMNATIDYKLDNILSNVTYTQLYFDTTIFPLMNATYENTLQILIQLGVLEEKINQTIALQNSTLNIVNQTQQDVELLVNRSNRIRAWITQ